MNIRGFYAVLDRDDEALAHALVDPSRAGARILQVRLKTADTATLVRVCRMARSVTRAHGAALVVNDRLDVALAVGADGVHLGQTDLPVVDARRISRLAIGLSTHNLDQVRDAIRSGVDYIGFGPVFPTATKPDPDPVQGIAGLAAAVAESTIPVVAIGGITPATAPQVAATGAAAACVIGAITSAPDPAAAGRQIGAAFQIRQMTWPKP